MNRQAPIAVQIIRFMETHVIYKAYCALAEMMDGAQPTGLVASPKKRNGREKKYVGGTGVPPVLGHRFKTCAAIYGGQCPTYMTAALISSILNFQSLAAMGNLLQDMFEWLRFQGFSRY